MKKKNALKTVIGIVAVLALGLTVGACNNYFHELIPPNDTLILSFYVDGQIGDAEIFGNTVTVTVDKGVGVKALIPQITVSDKATLIPVTLDYVRAAFPTADLTNTTMKLIKSSDLVSEVTELIKTNPDFNVPPLNIPIDFTGPVTMIVVGGQGSMRQYTVNVVQDSGEPRLLNIRFSKYDNAELISDAPCTIDEERSSVYANAVYPAEMTYLSYALIPSFEILGDALEVDGTQIVSGADAIQFSPSTGTQSKTITITRDGITKNYSLTVLFTEDADSIRSITDFRFNRLDNANVSANAVGSIINTDNTGTITVQVLYSGAKPPALIPRFVSPGTVSVNGATQTSGVNSHDFSSPFEYRVVSRNGQFARVYTVKVEFISVTENIPRFKTFRLSSVFNSELVQDAAGQISDGLILIDAYYGGSVAPTTLVPEFSAEGIVTVYGSVQVSGASAQDFTRQIKYTVTNPLYPTLTHDYWVQCRMLRDTSSDATITAFGFYSEENGNLSDDIIAKIDQINGKITIYARPGSGATVKTMIPRFTAAGLVNIEGTPQVSGVSGRVFDSPVTYTVVSANGKNARSYMVNVRELQTTIYVNGNARGMNDGMTWQDAFISIKAACAAAAEFPDDVPKEIWIAAGTYSSDAVNGFTLTDNTSYIGGFAGNETAKNQRNVSSNKVIVSGDLSGGVKAEYLFYGSANGDLSFENLQMKNAKNGIYSENGSGNVEINNVDLQDISGAYGVYFAGLRNNIKLSNITANNVNASYYSVYLANAQNEITLENSTFKNSAGVNITAGANALVKTNDNTFYNITKNNALNINGGNNVLINRVKIDGVQNGRGIYSSSGSGNVEMNNVELQNISSNYGIYFSGSRNNIKLSNITANYISGYYSVALSGVQKEIVLENTTIKNSMGINLSAGASALIKISDNVINNGDGTAFYINGGNNVIINRVKINGLQNGGYGLYSYSGSGNVEINNFDLQNTSGYYGIYSSGSRNNIKLSNVTANNVNSNYSVYIYNVQNEIVLENSTFKNSGGVSFSASENTLVKVRDTDFNKIVLSNTALSINGGNSNINYVNIDGVQNDYGRGMYISDGTVQISNSTIKNIKTSNDGGGVYIYSSAKIAEIYNTTIENVDASGGFNNGGGIYFGGKAIKINNSTIKNVKAYFGGAIYTNYNTNSVEISGTTIETVEAQYGGGIDISSSANVTIKNCTIRNAKAQFSGGAILSSSAIDISGTTIENVVADYGAGIYLSTTAKSTIRDCIFKNTKANNYYGAIAYGSGSIIDSQFINCTALNNYKIINSSTYDVIRGCTFTHDANLPNMGTRTVDYVVSIFGENGGNFDNCTFNNLKGNMPSGQQDFLFNSWNNYRSEHGGPVSTGVISSDGANLTLKNCTFNLNSGSAGLLALFNGNLSTGAAVRDYLLMDGVKINDNGGQTPLIWFHGSNNITSGSFQFKANNEYNGENLTLYLLSQSLAPNSNVFRVSITSNNFGDLINLQPVLVQ